MITQYAYIPLAQVLNLPNPDTYTVRIAAYRAGVAPDVQDSNGVGIPNVIQMEMVSFTDEQKADIIALGGEWFESATDYLS